MAETTFYVTGVSSYIRTLKSIDNAMGDRIVRRALRLASKPILKTAKDTAPVFDGKRKVKGEIVEGGRLKKSIVIKPMRRKRGRIGFVVMTNSLGAYKGKTFYGMFINDGTKERRTGRSKTSKRKPHATGKVKARKWMNKAYTRHAHTSAAIIKYEIMTGLEKELAKQAARAAKKAAAEA